MEEGAAFGDVELTRTGLNPHVKRDIRGVRTIFSNVHVQLAGRIKADARFIAHHRTS